MLNPNLTHKREVINVLAATMRNKGISEKGIKFILVLQNRIISAQRIKFIWGQELNYHSHKGKKKILKIYIRTMD